MTGGTQQASGTGWGGADRSQATTATNVPRGVARELAGRAGAAREPGGVDPAGVDAVAPGEDSDQAGQEGNVVGHARGTAWPPTSGSPGTFQS